jgi:hydrogenase-4 component E
MRGSTYATSLDLAAGALLLLAVLAVWRRQLRTLVGLLSLQGAALAAIPVIIGLHLSDPTLVGVGAAVLVLRGGILPWLVRRMLPGERSSGDSESFVNVTASLLAVALLTGLAYAVSQPIVALAPSPATRAAPVAIAVVLTGLFILITRRRALTQVMGFIILDNGIAALAFLITAGFPLIVELGASIDILLGVVILQVLTGRMRIKFGGTDIDQLRQLRD